MRTNLNKGKRFFAPALAAGIALAMAFTFSCSQQIDWSATKITITTEAQLRELATLVNAGNDFKGKIITLAKSIGIKDGDWVPIGTIKEGTDGKNRIEIPFNGVFDGNGKIIKGVIINGSNRRQGLFGYVGEMGTIKNLGVVDATIAGDSRLGILVGSNNGTIENCYTSGNVIGNKLVGGLIGTNISPGKIENSHSSTGVGGNQEVGGLVGYSEGAINNSYAVGDVKGDNNIGGLVGENESSTITNSYASGNVIGNKDNVGGLVGANSKGTIKNSYASGGVKGNNNVGGLVGENISGSRNKGKIENSYATGNIDGSKYVGGLVGYNHWYSIVSNCYTTGNVTGNQEIGGLVGGNIDGVIENSYALQQNAIQLVGFNNSHRGSIGSASPTSELKTAEQMKQQNIYKDWDFTKVWAITTNTNGGLPYLRDIVED
jgi:hypothetical protein